MLQGFYGSHRQMTMGSNGRSHSNPQAMVWSRSLRGTHDNTVKKLRKEMEAKRRGRLLRKSSEEDAATPSCSHRETPPLPRRPKSAEVQGAKKLLRMLHLDHMLSDVEAPEDADVAKPKKKMLKLNGTRRPSLKKLRPKAAASPVKRDVSPLTSWRMDSSVPKRDHVTMMSSQKTVKEPVVTSEEEEEEVEEEEEEDEEDEEEEEAAVTQWRYKPLPGEQETRNPSARRRPRRDFDLDELRVVVMAMQKEYRQCIRSVAESLEHHTRQIVLLTKANSSLANHLESMEKEMKVLRAMQFVCTTIP